MQERPTPESPQVIQSRSKLGLETPLSSRLVRETRIIIAPPLWYDILTWASIAFGSVLTLFALTGNSIFFFPTYVLIWAGPLVAFAGVWGQLSSERMTLDLRTKMYARREGQGLFKRIIRGPLTELDAIVLLAENDYRTTAIIGQSITYRLVLHWKNGRHPLLIMDSQTVTIRGGQAINSQAGGLAQKGAAWSRFLALPFYDNSYFLSQEPLKPF